MRNYLVGAALGVLLVLVLGWVGSCAPPWDTAEAKSLRERSDSLVAVLAVDSVRTAELLARVAADSAARDSAFAARDSANARAARESREHARTAANLRSVLRGSGADTTSLNAAERLITDMETRHAAAMREKDVAIDTLTSNVDRLLESNGALAVQLAKLQYDSQQAVSALTAERDFWQDAAERQARGFLGLRLPKWVEPVVFAGAGVYVGTLIGK